MVRVRSDSINIEYKLYVHTYIGCHVENSRRLKRSLTLIAFAINTRFPLSCRFFMFARTNARKLWLRSRIIDTRVTDSFYFLLVNESSSNSLFLSLFLSFALFCSVSVNERERVDFFRYLLAVVFARPFCLNAHRAFIFELFKRTFSGWAFWASSIRRT